MSPPGTKAGDGIRTHDVQLGKLETPRLSGDSGKTYNDTPRRDTSSAALCNQKPAPDPDLERVIAAWPDLPEPTRQAVLAVVRAAASLDATPPGAGGAQ